MLEIFAENKKSSNPKRGENLVGRLMSMVDHMKQKNS